MLFREFLKNTLIKKGDKELLLIKCLKKDPQTRTKEDNNTIKNFLRNTKIVPALLEIPFFEQKNCDKFLNLISGEVKHREVNQDETLFEMGTQIDNLFIIYNGSVAIENLENYTVDLTCKQYLREMIDKYQHLYNHRDNYMMTNKNDLIPLKEKENDNIEIFLCEKRHLFKRFCRKNKFIYIYNFYNYEKANLNKKKKKKNSENDNEEENNDKLEAIFICEQENCNAKYKYNFSTNRFTEIKPHINIEHDIIKNAPSYYDENINILMEKPYITDIQLVVVDN